MEGKIKSVTRIETSEAHDRLTVDSRGFFYIKKTPDGTRSIFNEDGVEVGSNFRSAKDAHAIMLLMAVDHNLEVSGSGKHSGKKFHQLPGVVQTKILDLLLVKQIKQKKLEGELV